MSISWPHRSATARRPRRAAAAPRFFRPPATRAFSHHRVSAGPFALVFPPRCASHVNALLHLSRSVPPLPTAPAPSVGGPTSCALPFPASLAQTRPSTFYL
ncbi:hypothetical protein AcW2_006931 [Taiwanofungus camphoratus]|nr:hypothetical protein AcW2_006931 [Antrodia cinnamomea]